MMSKVQSPAIQNRSAATEPTEIREWDQQRKSSVGPVALLLVCIHPTSVPKLRMPLLPLGLLFRHELDKLGRLPDAIQISIAFEEWIVWKACISSFS